MKTAAAKRGAPITLANSFNALADECCDQESYGSDESDQGASESEAGFGVSFPSGCSQRMLGSARFTRRRLRWLDGRVGLRSGGGRTRGLKQRRYAAAFGPRRGVVCEWDPEGVKYAAAVEFLALGFPPAACRSPKDARDNVTVKERANPIEEHVQCRSVEKLIAGRRYSSSGGIRAAARAIVANGVARERPSEDILHARRLNVMVKNQIGEVVRIRTGVATPMRLLAELYLIDLGLENSNVDVRFRLEGALLAPFDTFSKHAGEDSGFVEIEAEVVPAAEVGGDDESSGDVSCASDPA